MGFHFSTERRLRVSGRPRCKTSGPKVPKAKPFTDQELYGLFYLETLFLVLSKDPRLRAGEEWRELAMSAVARFTRERLRHVIALFIV